MRARLLPSIAVVAALGLLAACEQERPTPEGVLREALGARKSEDAARLFALQDADSRAYFLQQVRTARARLAAGESVATVLPDDGGADLQVHSGALEDAAARWSLRHGWAAAILEELGEVRQAVPELHDEPGRLPAAVLRFRARDGSEHTVWFREEPGGWKIDAFRHFQESLD